MKRIIISESEKNSILMNHIHHGYNTILEQEEEIIVTDHDKNWDYKKVGDECFPVTIRLFGRFIREFNFRFNRF